MSELIAEARVLVTPDTAAFRQLLISQTTAAAKGVTVPVNVVPATVGTTAATQAASQAAGAQAAVQNALASSASSSSKALVSLARAEEIVVLAQKKATVATTETSAARIRYAASIQATLTTERALQQALSTTDPLLIKVARDSLTAARANEALALSALEAAKAENLKTVALTRGASAQSAALSQVTRGAGGAALSIAGLRGATLAATGPFLAGAAAFAVFAKSVSASASLETSLNTFRVTADATADDLERISGTARQLGTDLTLPGVTAQSAADALAQLARAGLDVEDSIDGVRGVLQLATAAAIDNETAVVLVAGALNAFKLEGTDAERVADLLAASSKESQGSIEDMGLALQQAASASAQAGISVEDTIAILTQLGRAGLRGSDAGTSLRTAILRIINPSKKAGEALARLGVELRDLEGNIRPEVFAEIAEQAAKLGPAQRDATIALIGGQDAFRSLSILGREGAQGLNEMRESTQEVGVAAELASARTEGLAGAWENLKNQGEGLALSIGDGLNTPLTDFVTILAEGVQNINTFIGFLDQLGDSSGETGTKIEVANKQFQELVAQAGRINFAVAQRGSSAGEGLLEEQEKLNKELVETQSASLKARDGIEGYTQSVRDAALQTEGLSNRIDESQDRFARSLPDPESTQRKPPGIGPTAKLDAASAIAASNDDLREVERIQEIQLANAQKAFANSKGNIEQRTKLFEDMGKAEAALNSTRRQIADRATADAKTAATELARKQKEADDAFLSQLNRAESGQQAQILRATATTSLKDDIAETKALKQLYLQQRKNIQERVKDGDARKDAIAEATKKIAKTEQDIRDLIKDQAEARKDALDQIAENLSITTQIAELRAGDVVTEAEKDTIVKALNAEIANQRKRIALAKKAKKGVQQERLVLEQLLAQKRDLLSDLDDDKDKVGGTDLADLFERAQDILGGAGNVGFTTQGLRGLSATPRIQAEVQQRLDIVADPVAARQEQATRNLINAINQLTAAIQGSGNGAASPTGQVTRRDQNIWKNMSQEQRFFYQKQAKFMVENGLVG